MVTREGVLLYTIRLPDGRWWRRGGGQRPGGPTPSLRWATAYRSKAAAQNAARTLSLETKYGGYDVVECPWIIGGVVVRVDCPSIADNT